MKKTATILLALIISVVSFSQEKKKDTTIQITMSLDNYRAILYSIDANIDSKKVSKEILDFLIKAASIKPEEEKKSK